MYMGQQNIQFDHRLVRLETAQHGHSHLYPDPYVFYGSITSIPEPNIYPLFLAPEYLGNYAYHPMQKCLDSPLIYGLPPNTGVWYQHPSPNLDLSVASPSYHYNPHLAPSSLFGHFSFQENHRAHDQFLLSTTYDLVGNPIASLGPIIPFMENAGGSFKRKNVEGDPSGYQQYNAPRGPNCSTAHMTPERDGSNDPRCYFSPIAPTQDECEVVTIGTSLPPSYFVLTHTTAGHIHGTYFPQHVRLTGNNRLYMHFGANNSNSGTFSWTEAPSLPHGNASINEAGLLHLPTPPVHDVRGHNVNHHPSQVATSRGIFMITNAGINCFQGVVGSIPSFHIPPTPLGLQVYQPHHREILPDSNGRHNSVPLLRVMPEDEVAVLEIPGYNEVLNPIDQHRDMRLDIDHMSYEELLALEEQIGRVGTGLPEEFIQNHLKTRTFSSSSLGNLEAYPDQEINFCVVCQHHYKLEDNMATLDCGHCYHRECIKKWLLVKNSCPVCKSTALTAKGNVSK